jgi:hypothetical protein
VLASLLSCVLAVLLSLLTAFLFSIFLEAARIGARCDASMWKAGTGCSIIRGVA